MKRSGLLTALIAILAAFSVPTTLAQEDRQPITIDNATMVAELATIDFDLAGGRNLAFSPDGSRLAVGSSEGLRLLDVVTGAEHADLLSNQRISALAFSPDGTLLAATTVQYIESDNTINSQVYIWDIATLKELFEPFQEAAVNFLAFSLDGAFLAYAVNDLLPEISGPAIMNTDIVSATLYLVEIATGKKSSVNTGEYIIGPIFFSPDGKLIFSTNTWHTEANMIDSSSVHFLDLNTDQEYKEFPGLPIAISPNWTVMVSKIPNTLGISSQVRSATASVLDVETGEELFLLDHGDATTTGGVAFSPDGSIIASFTTSLQPNHSNLYLWDALTGTELAVLDAGEGWTNAVTFSPDGTMLATIHDLIGFGDRATGEPSIKIWAVT